MSVLYLAPFFERNCLGEAATANVSLLAEHMDVTCRPIGRIEQENPIINNFSDYKGADYLIIHSRPEDFCWKAGFKKVIGITHLKNPLIDETNFKNYFSLPDEVYHDSSFDLPGIKQIRPFCDKKEYSALKPKTGENKYKFLIVGNPTCYEEIYSVIRAFCEEFRWEEDVDLTIKFPQHITIPQFGEVLKTLQNDIRKYTNLCYPQLFYNNTWLSRKALLECYNEFDCIINCSIYNEWSRPFLDCLFLNKRGILLLREADMSDKWAYGLSEYKDYPVGASKTFISASIKRLLRDAFSGKTQNLLNTEDFSKERALTQLMATIYEPQTKT